VLIMWLWGGLVAFGSVLVSLYGDEQWTWTVISLMAATTISLTFLLPRLPTAVHNPR
jgi:UDP-GlcNAc:undecaprenyl-phosphate GlcNAc-1-phosphate transferase